MIDTSHRSGVGDGGAEGLAALVGVRVALGGWVGASVDVDLGGSVGAGGGVRTEGWEEQAASAPTIGAESTTRTVREVVCCIRTSTYGSPARLTASR